MPIMPTLGAPVPVEMQQPSMPATSLGQTQAQILAAQKQQALAQALMQAGYVPNSGPMGAIAQAFSAYRGNKLDKRAGETMGQALERKFAEESRIKLAEEARAEAKEMAKEQRQHGMAKDLKRSPGEAPTSVQEFQYGKEDPAYIAFLERQNRAKGTNVSVNMPGENYAKPFDEALAKSDVAMMDEARKAAMDAQRSQASASELKSVLDKIPAGKPQLFYGQMSQYFGGKAGADFQAQKALVEDQVNAILNAAKGPQTDQDAERARAQIPNMGTDPRAREIIFDYIQRKNAARITEFKAMDAYGRQNGNLQGFEVPVSSPAPDARTRKVLSGKTYEKRDGQWYEVQ